MAFIPEQLLAHVAPFILVLTRLGGLFIFAPLLSSPTLPRQAKIFLLLALGAVTYPTLDLHAEVPMSLDLYDLAPLMATELIVGMALGIFVAIPFASVQLGGMVMGQQMGLGIAQVINPGADISGDILGQMLYIMTMGAFVWVGGLELLIGGVVLSFGEVPLGGFALHAAPLDVVVGLLTAGFELAIRIAMPVLAIIFLENVALGFIMKTVPSLNILNFGFPIRILIGLAVFGASIEFMRQAIEQNLGMTSRTMLEWIGSL